MGELNNGVKADDAILSVIVNRDGDLTVSIRTNSEDEFTMVVSTLVTFSDSVYKLFYERFGSDVAESYIAAVKDYVVNFNGVCVPSNFSQVC